MTASTLGSAPAAARERRARGQRHESGRGSAAPSLFALDAGDYSLRLHAQHAGSRMWKSQNLLQHKAQAYEVVGYRTEIRIVDGNGRALPNHQVTLTVEKDGSAVEVAAGGRLH